MQLSSVLRTAAWITALCLCAQGQTPPAKDAPPSEAKGMPPRTAPTEYQSHAQAGPVTIAAEFTGHAIGTPQVSAPIRDREIRSLSQRRERCYCRQGFSIERTG